MKLRQRGNPNKNQKDYICNIPVRPKKRGGGGWGADIFGSHMPPNYPT